MRLFVAATPPGEIRDLLVKTYSEIERARWVKKEQLHITLRFLGELDADQATIVGESLREIAAPRFSLRMKGVGTFGRPARVLWCGLEPKEEITSLADAIDRNVLQAGLTADDKPFAAHLTIARFKNSPPPLIRRFLERNENFETPEFSIDEFTLYQSKLSPKGAEYSVVQSYPLADRS
jgi:2'-5' RNA ligase